MHKNGKWILDLKLDDGRKKRYEMKVAVVRSRWPDGTPKDLELCLDKKQITIHEGMEFMTLFCPSEMMGNEGEG